MTNMRTIPVNSIMIPGRFVALCEGWAGDCNCMLRAVSSTGNLTTGTHRPTRCDGSDEKWYLSIWCALADDVFYAVKCARKGHNAPDDGGDGDGHDADYPALVRFEAWVDRVIAELTEDYDLDGWVP